MFKTLLIASGLALVLFAGCSKSNSVASGPKIADLGAVEMTYDSPTRRDVGDGLVCVFTARTLNAANCELVVSLERSGRAVATSRVGSAPINQPLSVVLGNVTVNLTPQPK